MLPKKEDNIYPYTKKNVKALLNHCFSIPFGDIDWIFDLKNLEINQLEYIAKQVMLHESFFKKNLGEYGRTVNNFMTYGIDALLHESDTWEGSKSRKRITKEFRDLISNNI